jgi:NTP pyrophosphatase (non-canonical NTP hydrolase)
MSFSNLEMKVIRWAEDRGIIKYSTSLAQTHKTQEELDELVGALTSGDEAATKDAYGDILVTLIVGCACANYRLVDCLELAYNQIKDRQGRLLSNGIFVKEEGANDQ